jgi:dipeptidyl aminopeptidase/acylaminoacyl peptidase
MPRVHALLVAVSTALLLLAPFAPQVAAQGRAADYDRARSYDERFAVDLLGERADVRWLASDRLVVRSATPAGWSFDVLDARSATREPAFDHAALAAALTRTTGREFDATRLALRVLAFDERNVDIVLDGDAAAYRVTRDGSQIEALDPSTLPGATLERTNRRRSLDRGAETRVTFVNESTSAVDVVWCARDRSEVRYAELAPGERHAQHTFAGHVWFVRRADGSEAGPFEARDTPGLVLVRDGDFAERETRRRERGDEPQPGTSPDGRLRLVVDGERLGLRDVASGADTPLDFPSAVAGERTEGIHWSPDGTRVVVKRVLPGERRTVHIVDSAPDDSLQPRLVSFDYTKPGDRIDEPRFVLFDGESAREIALDRSLMATPWSLDVLATSPDGRELWLLYNARGHRVQRVVAIDFASGALRTLVEEAPATFVDYSQKTWVVVDAQRNRLLWASERSGWNHLYAIDAASGAVTALTSGEWVVRAVDEVDLAAGVAWIRALGCHADQDPYHVHFGRVDLVKGGVTWLTSSDGTHTLDYGPEREFAVATWSRVDHAPVHELRRVADGALVCELSRADASELLARGWRAPERFAAPGRDGTTEIWGVIHTPTDFDPTRSYPVIESIYAGPHDHHVPKSFARSHGVHELTELGFVVVQIDGMGTNWRSKAFHDVCWQNLGDSGFPDRIAWLRAAAATRPWMDLEHVGIFGGSAGGQSALRAVLAHGDFYDAAAADCGCHDNRMDKIWWNEAWMGCPIGPHYAEQSNVTNAHRLTGALLLTVGELDTNVDPASTMQVVDALVRADKDFELIVFPGAGHGAGESDHGRRRRQDFFVRHLLGVEPRRP